VRLLSTSIEPVVADFLRRVRSIQSMYHSLRIISLFADRGNNQLSPVVTRMYLLHDRNSYAQRVLWQSKSLKIMESIQPFSTIDQLLENLTQNQINLNSIAIGFYATEEPSWSLGTEFHRGSHQYEIDCNNLTLRGSLLFDEKRTLHGHEPHFLNELRLNPRATFNSISELSAEYLGESIDDIGSKQIEIIASSYLRITNLRFHGRKVDIAVRCRSETVPLLVMWASFFLPDGNVSQIQPRFRNPDVTDLGNGFVEIQKQFTTPDAVPDATSVRITVSARGNAGYAMDSSQSIKWPVENVIRTTLQFLNQSKVEKHFEMQDFETRYAGMGGGADSDILESVVACSIASCGLNIAFTGLFGLSCIDTLAFFPNRNDVLVLECTVGSPSRKIGLMKTALRDLRNKCDWLNFHGLVITSNYSSDQEKRNASNDGVILLDVTDLKTMVQMASDIPNPKKIMDWLGIS
jgi:hypothetical protein